MSGFDCLGTEDELGFDYMSLVSAVPGLLSGAGGMLSGGKGGGDAAAAAERARLEEEKRRAEQSAATMKTVLIVIGSLVGVGGIVAAITLGRR